MEKKTKENKVTVVKENEIVANKSIDNFITQAIKNSLPVETMEKLLKRKIQSKIKVELLSINMLI